MTRYRDNPTVDSVTEREKSTSLNDGRQDSGLPPSSPATSLDSRGLLLRGKLRVGDDGMSRLLTVNEVAAVLNVPRKWVYRRVGLKPPKGIPYLKVGKYLRVRESDLRDYVERLRRN